MQVAQTQQWAGVWLPPAASSNWVEDAAVEWRRDVSCASCALPQLKPGAHDLFLDRFIHVLSPIQKVLSTGQYTPMVRHHLLALVP
jgi:hypothetical protein